MQRGIESSSGVFTQSASSSFNNTHRINLLLIFAILYCAVNNALAQSTTICIGTPDAKAEGSTTPVVSSNHSMVLAQANTQETDGKIYTAEVIQIDGSKKVVTYHRDIRGIIIAPPMTDGKLVDGNEAPNNPVEARVAQKKILVKYDRSSLTMLAMVGPKDLIKEAFEDIKIVSDLVEKGRPITKEQIQKRLLGLNILILSGEKVNEQMKLTDVIATTQLKMSASEINRMKHETELKAIQIWKSTTGAVVAE